MTEKLQNQALYEAERAAKEKKGRFGGVRTSGAVETDKTIYFDDFARRKESPKKDLMTINVEHRLKNELPVHDSKFRRPDTVKGPCEWDRLMKEREELLQSGCYTHEDPLIKEIERQI